MSEYRVNVYEDEYAGFEENTVVGRVRYNSILDYWDGRNWCNGGVGRHKGITKLKDGRYVLIEGTNWQGERDFAFIIDKERALQEILKSGHKKLLKMKKWKELNELYLSTIIAEEDEDDEEE